MPTRQNVLIEAINKCLEELYSIAQPSITIEEFKKECENYTRKYKIWERYNSLSYRLKELTKEELVEYSTYPTSWKDKSRTECIGPTPCEFYYVPGKVQIDIHDSYVYAYEIDKHQSLLDTIKILKDYCEKPIVDKYVEKYTDENGNHHPGYRSYDHPDNLEKEIQKLIQEYDSSDISKEISEKCCNKFFEFLDMAGNFFNWNGELNNFNISVWDGSPSTNKQAVIDNWKKYRNQKIEIDDDKFNEEQDYD